MFFIMSYTSASKLLSSSFCGGHFLDLSDKSVIKACRSAIRSARSAMFRLVAMSLASLLIALIVLVFAFL